MELKKTLIIAGASVIAVSALGASVFVLKNKAPENADVVISKAISKLEKLEKDNFHMDMKTNIIGNVDYTGVNGNIKMDFPIHSTTTLDIANKYAKGTSTTEADFKMNCEMNEFAQSFVGSSLNDDLSIHESNNVHIALDDDGNYVYTKNMTDADVPWNRIKANEEKFNELMSLFSVFENEDVQNVLKNGELTVNEDGYLVQVSTSDLMKTETFKKLMAPIYEQQFDANGNPLPTEYRNKIVRLIELFKTSSNMDTIQDSIEKASTNSKVIFQFSKQFELAKITTNEISISVDSILKDNDNNNQQAEEVVSTEPISTEPVSTSPIETTENSDVQVEETTDTLEEAPVEQEYDLDAIDAPIPDETPDAGEVEEQTNAQADSDIQTNNKSETETEPQATEEQEAENNESTDETSVETTEEPIAEEPIDTTDMPPLIAPAPDHEESNSTEDVQQESGLDVAIKCQFVVEFSKIGEIDVESVKPTEKIVLGAVVGKDLLSVDTNSTIDDVLVPFVILNRDLEVDESEQKEEEVVLEPMYAWEENPITIGENTEYSMESSPLALVEKWNPVVQEDAKHDAFTLYPFIRTTEDDMTHVMQLAYINRQTLDGLADDSFAYIIKVTPDILEEESENKVLENITLGGDIKIGSTEDDVIAAYGEPFTKTNHDDYSEIIYYGNQKNMMLSLEVKENVVVGITIEFYGD